MCAAFPELRVLVQLGKQPLRGTLSFEDLITAGRDAEKSSLASIEQQLDADQVFNIQFTSGTTGTPKGATLTHFNIVNNGFFVGEGMQLTADDRVCIPVPLYHCFGMVLGVLAAMTHGAASVFCGEGFEPLAVLETVAAERCTALHGVPTMFIAELEHPQVRRVRPVVAAHRHHGRIALSHRRDASGRRRNAHAAGHDLLRHDGNQSRQLPEPAR
jgi:fatty-acyl-CoA synthase